MSSRPSAWASVLVAIVGYAPELHAFSAVVTIHKLLAESELVVVAEVVSVNESRDPEPERVATARVVEMWKGSPGLARVEFVASPSWFACDISSARVGETVVLFLTRDDRDKRYRITHYGRGRMPILRKGGGPVEASIYEVVFPRSIPVRREAGWSGGYRVSLESLKSFVREFTSEPAV